MPARCPFLTVVGLQLGHFIYPFWQYIITLSCTFLDIFYRFLLDISADAGSWSSLPETEVWQKSASSLIDQSAHTGP